MISTKFVLVILLYASSGECNISPATNSPDFLYGAVQDILESSANESSCSVAVISDRKDDFPRQIHDANYINGVSVFFLDQDFSRNTTSDMQALRIIRNSTACLSFVVITDSPAFLIRFHHENLGNRLLKYKNKVIVASQLSEEILHESTRHLWTYEMLNVIIISYDPSELRAKIFRYVPFTYGMGNRFTPSFDVVGSWSPLYGLETAGLFREKYNDFLGAVINVTSLHYPPYWFDYKTSDQNGTDIFTHGGTDYNLMQMIAKSLNFTTRVIRTNNWDEVTDRVIERVSFITPVIYQIYPGRLEKWDFTMVFLISDMTFLLSIREIVPNWFSMSDPFSPMIWLCTGIFILAEAAAIYMISDDRSFTSTLQDMWKIALIQPCSKKSMRDRGKVYRFSLATFLLTSLITTTAYKTNLIAFLTMPDKPRKIETIQQLAESGLQITAPGYTAIAQQTFRESSYKTYNVLASRFISGISIATGIESALVNGTSQMSDRGFLQYNMENHWKRDILYLCREGILAARLAMPIPHDAPYEKQINSKIIRIIEAGLYGAKGERTKPETNNNEDVQKKSIPVQSSSNDELSALGISHLKGPMMLLSIGWIFSIAVVIVELLIHGVHGT